MNSKKRKYKISKLLQIYSDHCFYCQIKLIDNKDNVIRFNSRTIDHIIPIAKGGTDSIENLILSCRGCNVKRGSKHFLLFLKENKIKTGLRVKIYYQAIQS